MRDDEVIEKLLRERFSCRAFLPDSVPEATIERLLELAQRTPSWCNTQPWHVYVTRGQATERFRAMAVTAAAAMPLQPDLSFPQAYTGVRQQRRREVAWQLYDAVGVARGDREASAAQAALNFELFGAPHVAVVTTARELGDYGAVDCGLYLATFLAAARSLGIDTIAQAAIASIAPAVREFFAIPDDQAVLAGISFGFADRSHPANGFRAPRADLTDVVTIVD